MDSGRLSARRKQPGHDRTFEASESNFIEAAKRVLDLYRFTVIDKPRDLRSIFSSDDTVRLGLAPEAKIESRLTGRKFFVEVKKQGPRGNAEERACKHHTVQFYRTMFEVYGYDYHPYVSILCEDLAVNPRYTRKMPFLYEPQQYLLWVEYDLDILSEYLNARAQEWLEA